MSYLKSTLINKNKKTAQVKTLYISVLLVDHSNKSRRSVSVQWQVDWPVDNILLVDDNEGGQHCHNPFYMSL